MGYAFCPSIESAGRIPYVWDCAWFFELSRVCQPRFVAVKSFWVAGDGHLGLIYIYAPNEHSERVNFSSV